MTDKPIRPTWKLGDEDLPATFPTDQIDPDAAFVAALAADVSYERMNDVTEVLESALGYAAETMRDGLAELAFMARDLGADEPLRCSSGWLAFWEPGPVTSNIDLMLVHPVEPGSWHVSIRFDPVMTDPAEARLSEVSEKLRSEQKAAGMSEMGMLMASLFPKAKDGPLAMEMKRIEHDPESYRRAERGDKLELVASTALDLGARGWKGVGPGGKPVGNESFDQARKFLPISKYQTTWWHALDLYIQPVRRYDREKGMLKRGTDRSGPSPQISMEILTDLVRSNGLDDLVALRAAETAGKSWISFGDERSALLSEAGHASVHAAGGFFDATVTARIRDFSAAIAAKDLDRHLHDIVALGAAMDAHDYTSKGSTFECNDGRDIAHVRRGADNVRSLFNKTQHGHFRLDLHEDGDGAITRVTAVREHGGRDHVVGRFVMTDEGLRHDYGGETPIDYTIRNIRDMNGIILSLSSVCCCFDEEHPKADDDGLAPC